MNVLAHRKNLKTKSWKNYSIKTYQILIELGETLQVDESTVSKRLKVLGMIHKQGHWVSYELKLIEVERHFLTCELLLQQQKRKGFLHCIVTGDEKWIHYDNPKHRK
ncbi:Mariner Mos1 transposase [Eumeta japonica]|uniref:Mariner Mos1 transposase n=1 Tax=Eumeta variegata TaxID=151549 RepID=A0A4C1YHX0_EUMVA|nr:Mariner Mos1 transposase [Eumeta japonica]